MPGLTNLLMAATTRNSVTFEKFLTMKKLFSISYSAASFNTAMLLLRVGAGILIFSHGYQKLVNYDSIRGKFLNFLGLGSEFSLVLIIFAECLCAILLALGLFTRLAVIPLIIGMFVAMSRAHNFQIFDDAEKPALFFLAFLTILFLGPGRMSIDGMIRK